MSVAIERAHRIKKAADLFRSPANVETLNFKGRFRVEEIRVLNKLSVREIFCWSKKAD